MNLSLEKLKKYGFGVKVLTETDFYAICEKEQIKILEMDAAASFYFCTQGHPVIVLDKKLKGLRKLFAAFHELAHHFLHGGTHFESAFFFGLMESKNEVEADALALVALIPLSQICDISFLEENPNRYALKLFKDRQRLYFLYGI